MGNNQHNIFMQRCIQLAKLGVGNVAPNPLVGAVLVHNGIIIGEGYHRQFGKPHAEVNCINSVNNSNKHLISNATLYVSLEPCNHFGKTPPCSHFIVQHKIPQVVIGCVDTFAKVNGSGIAHLQANGINVITGVLENECKQLNNHFFTFHEKKRPFVIAKFAQTANGKIGYLHEQRLYISNNIVNTVVHQWRSNVAAILVGTNTALKDNPFLTNRLASGKNPVRLLLDKHLKVPPYFNIYNKDAQTVIFNGLKDGVDGNITFIKINDITSIPQQIMQFCYQHQLSSVLLEGGRYTLQTFLQENLVDEIRVITNEDLVVDVGVDAPLISAKLTHTQKIRNNTIKTYQPYCHAG